ncbi:MAG: hypothetical protein F4Z28_05900 [Gammaproteobacteria bacterium]|nr:hypothetical protein [Gammaproteobacteria bacterium]
MAERTRRAHEMFLGKAIASAGPVDHSVFLRENRHEEAVLGRLSRRLGVPNFRVRLEPESDGGSQVVLAEFESPAKSDDLTGIERLIAPLDLSGFVAGQYRHPQPMVFRGGEDRFSKLVTWDDLNDIVCSRNVRPALVHLITDGQRTPDYLYQQDDLGLGSRQPGANVSKIDSRKLANLLRTGSTLIVNAIHEYHPPVAHLAREIESRLATYVNVNLYASWHSTPGFATHWDDHDVFAIQMIGQKEWHLFGQTRYSPAARDNQPNVEQPAQPVWVGNLTAGDVLYIPRGWWHDARVDQANAGLGSLHLTLNTRAVTGTWILRWLESQLLDHEVFRRNAPLAADEKVRADYFGELAALIRGALLDGFGERFERDVRNAWTESTRTALSTYIEPWKSPNWDSFVLSLKGGRQASLDVRAESESFLLRANGMVREFDVHCLDLVRALAERESVSVAQLKSAYGDRFPADFIDGFIKQLVKDDAVFAREIIA